MPRVLNNEEIDDFEVIVNRQVAGGSRAWERELDIIATIRAKDEELAEYERKKESVIKSYRDLEYRVRQLIDGMNTINAKNSGNYHAWIPDEENHLETLSCPVLIPAEWLRNLLAEKDAEIEQLKKNVDEHIRVGIFETMSKVGVKARYEGIEEASRDFLQAFRAHHASDRTEKHAMVATQLIKAEERLASLLGEGEKDDNS